MIFVTVSHFWLARANKSLDASGVSGLVIDNLSVAQLLAAASTQPVGRLSSGETGFQDEDFQPLLQGSDIRAAFCQRSAEPSGTIVSVAPAVAYGLI